MVRYGHPSLYADDPTLMKIDAGGIYRSPDHVYEISSDVLYDDGADRIAIGREVHAGTHDNSMRGER